MNERETLRMTAAISGCLDWDDCIRETRERIRALRSSLKYFEEAKEYDRPFPVKFPKPSANDCFTFIEL